MSKILVKSTFPQADGWGKSARDYLQAFMKTGATVRANPIVLCRNVIPPENLPGWIPENGNNFRPDVYFQQCLPDYFDYFPGMKNIGFTFTETRHLNQTGWIEKMNEMDEMWVATQQEKLNLEESGVKKPINVVRMPMNFIETDEKLEELVDIIDGRFAFYFVGEFVQRKNIADLVLAYWREFNKGDDVVLILKTGIGNAEPEQVGNFVKQQIDALQKTYRLHEYAHRYPEVIAITETISDEDIAKMHNACDCFVTATCGESTCRPMLDAAYYGKPILCTEGIGAIDESLNITQVKANEEPCRVAQPPLPYLYTSYETWMRVSIFDLQNKMRAAYNKELETTKKESVVNAFSYDTIARQIRERLNITS